MVILGLNGVVVGSYGLILWENEVTRSKMLSRYLPTTGDFIINSKSTKIPKIQKSSFPIYIYIFPIYIYTLFGVYAGVMINYPSMSERFPEPEVQSHCGTHRNGIWDVT